MPRVRGKGHKAYPCVWESAARRMLKPPPPRAGEVGVRSAPGGGGFAALSFHQR
jgi:hypothetical protein